MGAASRGAVLLLTLLPACAVPSWLPYVVTPDGGLPADAFERCRSLLAARFQNLAVVDAAAFRLQSDWAPLAAGDVAGLQRATLFRDGAGVGVVVEVRWLELGWFDRVPAWSAPRPDPDAEQELGQAVARALGAAVPGAN